MFFPFAHREQFIARRKRGDTRITESRGMQSLCYLWEIVDVTLRESRRAPNRRRYVHELKVAENDRVNQWVLSSMVLQHSSGQT